MTTGAIERLSEAEEGVGFLRVELTSWIERSEAGAPPGAQTSRLEALRLILDHALDAVLDDFRRSAAGPGDSAYAVAAQLDRRVVFCRRLFRWYVLRFGQRAEPGIGACLLGADEVVWSAWARTFAVAGVAPPPAPLCFVDDDPVPWASFHEALPGEARPPSRDPLLTDRVRALPVPVIGLPPIVVRRPWWLVTAVHETGHHVQHVLGGGAAVEDGICQAARDAGAAEDEVRRWASWTSEMFADAFAAASVGAAWLWAVIELERAAPDWAEARDTYPPAAVRVALTAALVERTGAALPAVPGVDDPHRVAGLLSRVPAIAAALLAVALGRGTLRDLGDGGRERAVMRALWAEAFVKGDARSRRVLGAAEDCIAGAVLAWTGKARPAPEVLRTRVLDVLPGCRPVGKRTARPADDGRAAGAALARDLVADDSG